MKLLGVKQEEVVLNGLEERRRVLEVQVQAVAQGFTSALFCWGPPGLGKSYVLTTLLDGICGTGWRHHTAYSTPKGLFLQLAEAPNAVHLFEDCEKCLKMDVTSSILRAACGNPGESKRAITYETATEKYRVLFTGGIIIATNADLSRQNGPMSGVASRFRPVKWTMTLDERVALIGRIARQGWVRGKIVVPAKEAVKVAEALLDWFEHGCDESMLDIRLFVEHALPTYAHCTASGVKDWEAVLGSKLTGVVTSGAERQHERSDRLRQLAMMIDAGPGNTREKVASWKAKTGLGQSIYYRHLKEGKGGR